MMRNARFATLALVTLLVTAGCARKKADLPPPPPPAGPAAVAQVPGETAPPADTGPVGTTAIPGSSADFVAQAGTDKVLFGTDSYELDAESHATLAKQATWLAQYSRVKISVEGHCDERGTREYNFALGERRANAAKNYLAARGIDAARMSVISYGKERPASEGSDEAAWAANRRAVTVIVNGTAG
jgi:peptidoglycan-associated lipoprotein